MRTSMSDEMLRLKKLHEGNTPVFQKAFEECRVKFEFVFQYSYRVSIIPTREVADSTREIRQNWRFSCVGLEIVAEFCVVYRICVLLRRQKNQF